MFAVLCLNWSKLFNIFIVLEYCKTKSYLYLKRHLSEYKNVFKDDLGMLKDNQSTIPVNPTIKPKFLELTQYHGAMA